MIEQDFVITSSKFIVDNWKMISSAFFTALFGSITLTWFVFKTIHKKEVTVLLQRISLHEDNFDKFSKIMDQRLIIAEKETEILRSRVKRDNINLDNDDVSRPLALGSETTIYDLKSSGGSFCPQPVMPQGCVIISERSLAYKSLENSQLTMSSKESLEDLSPKLVKFIERVNNINESLKSISETASV